MKFADRAGKIKASEIRETLKLLSDPAVISFAGGNPDKDFFPKDEIKNSCVRVLNEVGGDALQYSVTEGLPELRDYIAKRMNRKLKTKMDADNILIVSGGQQALFLSGELFLNKGDKVITESPTYFGALNAFKSKEIEIIGIPLESDGINIELLEEALGKEENVKLIYVIPDFQNPTGWSWSEEKRKKTAEFACQYDIPIIEDSPYQELNYTGEELPTIKYFDKTGHVIYLGSFSKTFCPGFRLGWIAGNKDILRKYTILKQGVDLQTSTFTQYVLLDFLKHNDYDEYILYLKNRYKVRLQLMIEGIDKEFPSGCQYHLPKGGLFVWLKLPQNVDLQVFLKEAIKEKVAFIKGQSFFPGGSNEKLIRLNFSNSSEERITEGMARLGHILKEMLK